MEGSSLSQRLFVWTELALSRVLAEVARLRGEVGARTVAPR